MVNIIEIKTIYIFFHLLGVVLGMGGAFASDLIFFSSIRDERITDTELRIMRLASMMVWVGLTIILISGVLIFSINPQSYLSSTKFLAKMTIVLVLILNGVIFHLIHMPRFHRHKDHHFPSSDEFERKIPLLLIGGVVSSVSWISVLLLGALKFLPFSYLNIMSLYILIVVTTSIIVVKLKRKFIPHLR